MVAVVSGSNLGLVNAGAANGDAAVGLGRDRAYVNSTSGNLVVQSQDDVLSSIGLDSVVVRTYNSQGAVDGDNDDNWRIGFYRNLFGIPATPGGTNSTISKKFGDGTEVVYTYDTASGRYVGTDGDGAHDTLSYSGGTWTWTDGSGRNTETYDASGKLVNSKDADGNVVTYVYNGTLLIRVDDASGQQTHLIYNASRQLTDVQVVSNGVTQTLTKYAYDSLDRLERVTVDLTPSVTTDSVTYVTRYTYDGNSQRLASIINSDGTAASFTYQLIDGAYRVRSFTPTEAGLVTAPANTNALVTQIPQTTSADRNLTSSATPPGWGAFPTDLSTTTVAESNPIIKYDAAGNAFAAWYGYPTGVEEYHVFLRRYDAASGTWSAATVMDVGDGDWDPYAAYALALDVDASGNAVLAWTLGDVAGVAASARTYSASSGTWSSAQVLRAGDGIHKSYWSMKASINGSRAIVSWDVHGNYSDPVLLQTARFDGSSWQTTDTLDNNLGNEWKFISGQTIAMDAQGNALMMWSRALAPNPADGYQQYNNTYYRYFNAASGTWGAETLFFAGSYGTSTTASFGVGQTEFVFDNSGSIFATYRIKTSPTGTSDLMSRKFSVASQTWGSATLIESRSSSNVKPFSFAVTASGDAVMAYAWDMDVYVRTYSAASQSWSAETVLSNPGRSTSVGPGVPRVLVNNGQIAVTWVHQPSGTNVRQFVYMSRYTSSGWTVASNAGDAVVDGSTNGAYTSAMDRFGNVTALWGINYYQTSYPNGALLLRTFSPTPTYTIPSGATWSSVTQALYGDSSAAAVSALQAIIGAQPLTAGNVLRGLPSVLHVESTIMVPVTPYYNVTSTTTWLNIVQSVYGTTDPNAIDALRNNYFPGLNLADGQHLQVPLSLQFTASGSNTTLVTYNTGAVQNTANANLAALSTTDTQTTTTNHNVVAGSLSTTDTQTVNNSHNVVAGSLSTTDTTSTSTNHTLNSGLLSTTDTTTTNYNRNDAVLSTTDTTTVNNSAPVNSGALSTTDTVVVNNSAPLNSGALSTTDTQVVTNNYPVDNAQLSTTITTTTPYGLNTGALNPVGFAGTKSAFESQGGNTSFEQVQFDANGNGMAVWVRSDSATVAEIFTRTYSASTLSWSDPVLIATTTGLTAVNGLVFDMDDQGNALVAVDNVGSSTTSLIFAKRYSVSSGWQTISQLSVGNRVGGFSCSINGDKAIIGWTNVSTGLAAAATLTSGGAWASLPIGVQNTGGQVRTTNLAVAIDAQGNASALLSAFQTTNYLLQSQRFTASTGTWSTLITSMDSVTSGGTNSNHFTNLRVQFDANGNGFASWHRGQWNLTVAPQSIVVKRFDKASGSWSAPTTLASQAVGSGQMLWKENLSIDAAGTAMVAWEQRPTGGGTGQVFASYFNGSGWGSAVNLAAGSSGSAGAEIALTSRNGRFAAGFLQNADTEMWAARFESGAWQSATRAGTGLSNTFITQVALHANGDVTALWDEVSGGVRNLSMNQYATVARYTIPNGASWQSIASALYGVNSPEAGSALQSAMGSPPLIAGRQIAGWPSTLSVTVTASVAPYFTVLSGDSWQSIANRIYHVNSAEAANALQAAFGGIAVPAAGTRLNPPSSLSVTTTTVITVTPYYTIPSGASWQSVTLALYGTSVTAAASALQGAMGGIALPAAGNRLTGLPSTLSYQTTQTVTVAPYYTIPSGATWQSVTLALYGTSVAAAASALQAAMGGIALPAAGNRLTGLPSVLNYTTTTTVTVPAYYTIPSGASWQSVANAIYGVNSAAAASTLQSAMGGIALPAAGNRLTGLPATLSVTVTATVPPYYTVPSGASWQSIANTLYSVNSAAAGNALQAAMGGIAVPAAGAKLSGLPSPLTVTITTTTTVPPYYTIPSGATWQSIANAVYGANTAAAGIALQAAMGGIALPAAGNRLTGFPNPLTYTTTQTVTVPAYYTIPSGATWQSVANAVYGVNSTAAASALQAALGGIALPAAGNRLTGFPNPLAVTTTTTITVPAYYLVPSGATWASITQAVYGVSDPAAVARLQTVMGDPALTTGRHLTMPASITYTVTASGTPNSQSTDVQDAAGRITTFTQDAAGRLRSVLSPTTGGIRLETRYDYDSAGNLTTITEDPTGLNRVTTNDYDSRGNLNFSRDSLGNTISRTYDAFNQVLTETKWVVPDPDGAGNGSPGTPLQTRYVYDGNQTTSESHLRYVIDADGRVTQHIYNGVGQRTATLKYLSAIYTAANFAESDLNTWANVTANKTLLERTDYAYDFRGNINTLTAYVTNNASTGAGTGTPSVTKFLYDQRGQLLQAIEARGSSATPNAQTPNLAYATTYAYDGLGRITSTSKWDSASRLVTTLHTYDDANRRTTIAFANGLVTTSAYDKLGRLISVSNGTGGTTPIPAAFGLTTYSYDVGVRLRIQTDAALAKQFFFYDEVGRKVAQVDGDGSLTEYVYDRANSLIKTIQYSSRLNAANLAALVNASGDVVDVPLSTLRSQAGGDVATNRVSRNVFDAAGRLVYSIDESGAVSQVVYDGAGRVTDTILYATRIVVPGSVGQLLPSDLTTSGSAYLVSTSVDDRRSRTFYDNQGNLAGTLDAGGYIIERTYDNAGHLKQETRFANRVTDSTLLATGTLAQLKTAAGTDNETSTDFERDITTNYFYDGQGRNVGVLDGERFLTETVYDVAGNVSQVIRYNKVLTYSTSSTLTSLRNAALASPAAVTHTTSYQYDGFGRATQSIDYQGIQSNTTYDSVGNVVSATEATGTAEARTQQRRFDEMGRVVRELTGEGSQALATLLANNPLATAIQINDIWDRYGVLHAYDQAGRKVTTTVRPNDTQTNVARYYYDQEGRVRFEVNQLGERTEYRYNALDQLTDQITYFNRIAVTGLAGGELTQAALDALTASADATRDARITFTYDVTGRVNTSTSAEGASTTVTYNAFGQNDVSIEQIDATRSVRNEFLYNTRGLQTTTSKDTASGGLNLSEVREYDAFGRLTRYTDGRNLTSRVEYDRLGRQTASVNAANGRGQTTYDGFSRVLTQRDALLNTTTYGYDDATRTMTVTTPENIVVTTVSTRHGQTLSVTAAGNTTTYQYDLDGNGKGSSDNLGTLESRTYDRGGRIENLTDARGVTTRFSYDAANRTLTRTEDYGTGNLQLQTVYAYDALGRVETVTEPSGRLTKNVYDRDGNLTEVQVDPNGLNLRTSYTFDRQGRTLTMTEGVGSAQPLRTQYIYDNLGRRIEEIVDPTSLGGTLNLRTQYRFDGNGNATRRIDAAGNSTWYVYDSINRLTHTINALGNVTQGTFDAENHLIATRRYANTLSAATLTTLATLDSPTTANFSVSTNALDSLTRYFYDRDGREQYSIDAAGTVTERVLDAAGRTTRTRILSTPALTGSYTNAAAVTTALGAAAATISSEDRLQWTTYDTRGRLAFTVDGLGSVSRNTYDENGNVVATTLFASRRPTTDATDLASLQAWATANSSNTQNQTTRFWYDRLDRERFVLDAEGFLTETRYGDAARELRNIVYTRKPTLTASADLAEVTAAAAALFMSEDQVTLTVRDIAARIWRVYDAAGLFEEFTYDAVGNKQTYRNQKGSIWTYIYDTAGRLSDERSPNVAITTVSSSGTVLSSATETASIVTRMTYDGLGNVRTRTEGIRRYSNGTESTTGSRTTTYNYDVTGRQTSTVNPQVSVYNGNYTENTGTTSTTNVTPTSTATYDALGNATRNVDIGGGTSYRVYDNLGRVRYEIDALRYVTEHVYDVFGNEVALTRFSTALGSIPSYSGNRIALSTMDTAVSALRSNADNRTITKTYDRTNHVRSTAEPSVYAYEAGASAGSGQSFTVSPTTYFDYDAFGRVVREWKLVNPNGVAVTDPSVNASANSWATTHHYFDRRGFEIGTVDALRYLTRREFDETGDLTNVREYARALTTFDINSTTAPAGASSAPGSGIAPDAGYDRETMIMYDVLNRATSETLLNFEHAWINGQITEIRVANKARSYGYDALGNQTSISEGGATVYNYYDVLGRLTARAEPSRNPGDGSTLIPLTEIKRDIFGNAVEEIRYGAGAATVNATAYTLAATSAALERHSLIKYDALDRAVASQDARGAFRNAAYNARGDLVKEWQTVTNRATTDMGVTPTTSVAETLVTLYQFDALGQRTVTHEVQRTTSTAITVRTRATYNGFGEIRTKTVDGGWAGEFYEYDNAGRIWRTNAGDGVDKVYLYNLAGQVSAEIRSRTLNLADAATYANAASVNALTGTMRTENRYDLLNRVFEQRLPQFEIQATQDLIDSQPQLAVQATPNPPNALYRQIAVSGGANYAGPWGGVVYVPQIVSYAEGGGWFQVQAPSAANPYGVYSRYSSEQYSVSQQRQFSWQKPAYDVIATFEYWPASNPAAVSTLEIYTLAPDRVGVNVNALSGNYGYRISYKRVGATSAFAMQEGTFNTASNSVVRGTTAALQSQTVTPTVQQTFDRWGNVISIRDAAGGLTQYRYNQLNQLTYTLLPSAVILDTSFSIEQRVGRVQLSNYYDVNGRLFETRDATNNTTRVTYNNAGQSIRVQNADDAAQVGGSKKFFVYDAFNNVIQVKDELGYRTRNVYDKADNLVQVAREIELVDGFASAAANDTTAVNAANVVWEYYGFDETGRRISDTNGEGEVTKYWYDLRGNLIRRRTPRNFDTTFEYDAFARKTRETDANATFSTYTYDAFGRLTAHAEMVNSSSISSYFTAGGATHAYTYDEAGLLLLETTSLGKNRAMAYDAAGHLTSITDNGTALGGGLVSVNRVTTYNYDAAGRKSREREVIDGRTHQDTRIEYDGAGRIASLDDLDYRLQYFYDANGNRSLIKARYYDHQMVARTEELYYRYDQMNRVTISSGKRSTGAVPDVVFDATQGVLITYDAKGQRTSARTKGTRLEVREYRTNGVYVNTTYLEFSPSDQLGTDYYKYDGLGRLKTLSRETDFVIRETTTGDAIGGNAIPTPMSVKTYDKAGRQIREVNYVNEGPNLNPRTTVTDYDDDGRTTQETHYNVGAIESIVKFGDAGNTAATRYNGYDAANVLRGYKVDVYVSGAYKYTTSYQNAYRLGEGYQDTGQSVSSAGTNPPGPASNSRVYDVNGDLVQFSDSGDLTRTRYFANNASGQVLTSIQGQFDGASGRMTVSQAWDAAVNRSTTNQPKAQYFFFADGKHTGSFGQLQNADGTFDANFDVNYTPVSSNYPASAPSQVIAQTGDTLRTMAARIFGDAALWYVLAQENGLSDPTAPIKEGTVIKVPNEVVSLSNTSNVFKPFDAGDALGDTSPTQPAPPAPKPKKGGCGVIGMIIVAIVAIVVTVFTAGAAAAALAPMLGSFGSAVVGGAIGAAVGSIASQGVGIAIGVQDKFSWGAVAKAAIGGAIGGALFGVSSFDGSAIKGVANTGLLNNGGTFAKGLSTFAKSFGRASGFVQGAANAVVTNVVTQGASMAFGLQQKFSWRDVAASAAGGGVGAVVGSAAKGLFGESTLGTIATKTVTGFSSGVTQAVVRGGKIDYASIAADSFGNALGNSIVDGFAKLKVERQKEIEEKLAAAEAAENAAKSALRGGPIVNDAGMAIDPKTGKVLVSADNAGPPAAVYAPAGITSLTAKEQEYYKGMFGDSSTDLIKHSTELEALQGSRGFFDKLLNLDGKDGAVSWASSQVANDLKNVLRYGALVDSINQTYDPKTGWASAPTILRDEFKEQFNESINIDITDGDTSEMLSNALAMKDFVMEFKSRLSGVKEGAANVRRVTGILNLFVSNTKLGGATLFINKFAYAFEEGLGKVTKAVGKVTSPISKLEDIYEFGKDTQEGIEKSFGTIYSDDRINENYEIMGNNQNLAPAQAAKDTARVIYAPLDAVDKLAMKQVKEAQDIAEAFKKFADLATEKISAEDIKDK